MTLVDDPYDEAHDLDDAHDLRMAVMDRLLDVAPSSPSLVSPPAVDPRVPSASRAALDSGEGRRRPKNLDELTAQAALYGDRTRGGDVGPATPVRLKHCFRHCLTNSGPGAVTPRAA
jgi:hypothetical protein